jgi:hypothetical protein
MLTRDCIERTVHHYGFELKCFEPGPGTRADVVFELWPEGIRQVLAYRAPHTGAIVSARVEMMFPDQPFGGRRLWFRCPECPRNVRYLYGGKPHPVLRIARHIFNPRLRHQDRA